MDSAWMPAITFFVFLAVNWWASWYPGAEPGGGGYVAQRIFSAKDERHGLLATLWFNIAHYALRPWPWILTALASLILYPHLADKEKGGGYIQTLMDPNVFPPYLRGFMLAAFAAAYMSTIGTHLNWGASYVINDCYRRFVTRDSSERHYVIVSQVVTLLLMVVSMVVTLYMETISGAWRFLLVIGAGTGPVLLLRWFWWRVNAWSEVAAMVASGLVSIFAQFYLNWSSENPREFAYLMLVTVTITTATWLVVTLLTKPENEDKLIDFYCRVRPSGPGWKPIAARTGLDQSKISKGLGIEILNWVLGCVLIYCSLFGIGKLIFKEWTTGLLLIGVAIAAGVIITRNLTQTITEDATPVDAELQEPPSVTTQASGAEI